MLMAGLKMYFKSRAERICCLFGHEVLDKEQIYWVNPLGECGIIYGNVDTWGEASLGLK